MIQESTAKKMNAVDTALSILNDAGVECSFNLYSIPDEDVEYIASNHKVALKQPSHNYPYKSCVINKGFGRLYINGIRKIVNVVEIIEE